MTPTLSLIVPTRARPIELRRFLQSIADTTQEPDLVEIVLVVDADDAVSQGVAFPGLTIRQVVVEPGLSMGALNRAGQEKSLGRFAMLLNDDVIVRTRGWDERLRTCMRAYPDDLILIHVNDTLMQKHLCTFPVVSRRFCELAGGICPKEYRRYRIDDHIEDIWNLLGLLGPRRSLYLPDVVFEHQNFVTNEHGTRQYFAEATTLGLDAPVFDHLFAERKELALHLMCLIEGVKEPKESWRHRLDRATDPFALRTFDRLRVIEEADFARPDRIGQPETWWSEGTKKLRKKWNREGIRGLAFAAARRLGIASPR